METKHKLPTWCVNIAPSHHSEAQCISVLNQYAVVT